MNKHLVISEEKIVNKIFFIRNHKVMLDRDLAEMYGVKTKVLKQAVKRNIERFPEHFMFELTNEEFKNLRSQIVTSSWGGERYPPFAFTEHGILQLSNILKSKSAFKMSIRIIEVFVKMREMLSSNKDILLKLEQIEKRMMMQDKRISKNEHDIKIIFETIKQMLAPEPMPRKQIGFKYAGKK